MTTLLPSLLLAFVPISAPVFVPAQSDAEIEALVAAERAEADLLRRRGELRKAERALSRLLEDEPTDAASRTLRALCLEARGEYERALEDARAALEDTREGGHRDVAAACTRNLIDLLLTLGRGEEAREIADGGLLDPATDARDAWVLGRVMLETGDRTGAFEVFEYALAARADSWTELLAKARCERALGRLEAASRTLIQASRSAEAEDGREPDVFAELGSLYFESEREVKAKGARSAGRMLREALALDPTHAPALLTLFEMHRYNRRRTSRTPESILAELRETNPDSIEALLAGTSADLDDGQLRAVRASLARLEELAPGRREKKTLDAALAWVEHRRDDCQAILEELARVAPEDSRPEREVGRHLLELYRFSEGLPFLRRAVERDPTDYQAWTDLARALANTGDEDAARDAFEKANIAAAGRQDAWRNNMMLVLQRMKDEMVTEDFGELSFAWRPDASEVLREYLVPFYESSRIELAERYGHTPDPTHIEVFRRHEDFSVRSVGFAGFPALGVCFGPVVTSISPLSEMRGNFSWARTCFHEFSHVIHLGLSHNRCPRWITEGLATWEEVNRNPAWTRNMRRDLVDARANDDIIPVRELNRAFRGPRIIFGYYQGGLLCQMLIAEHGFRPMIHILEAFDRGLDVDQAFEEVFGTTPEQVDADFLAFVDEHIGELDIEPRWNSGVLTRLRLRLTPSPPEDEEERARWAEDWTTVAWGNWQRGSKIDAQEALRRVDQSGQTPLRAQFLRGEIALAEDRRDDALEIWNDAVELGGRDFRALVALGSLRMESGDDEGAEEAFLMAEAAFPGYDQRPLSAELRLAKLYQRLGREDEAMQARERWLGWNADDLPMRRMVAGWHVENERFAEAEKLYAECNEIDPFLRDVHIAWGRALQELERHKEALREFRIAAQVPPELDADHLEMEGGLDLSDLMGGEAAGLEGRAAEAELVGIPLTDEERAELLALSAHSLHELGQDVDSDEARDRALELDPDNELAKELLD